MNCSVSRLAVPLPMAIAGGGHQQAAHHFEGGGFPGAVGAEQAENFTALNLEISTLTTDEGRYNNIYKLARAPSRPVQKSNLIT